MTRAKAHSVGRLAALIAGLAILIQALAVAPVRAEVIELCTAHGVEKVFVQADDPGHSGAPGDCSHCGHCVLASVADLAHARLSLPVRYAIASAALSVRETASPVSARAPPRPFGQAPPVL